MMYLLTYFYNVINTVITQHITTLRRNTIILNLFDPVELEFVEEVFEYNDIIVEDGFVDFVPIEPEMEEISYETVELEIQFEMPILIWTLHRLHLWNMHRCQSLLQ